MIPLLADVATAPPKEPPGLFARATEGQSLAGLSFLSPGVTWLGWQPVRVDEPTRAAHAGVGAELSFVHWVGDGTYVGAVGHVERVDRTRGAFGLEAGYQLVGLELSIARELAEAGGPHAQWSLQIAPYASIGMLYLSPRWIVALDRRRAADGPGDGAMFVVGVKIPLKVGG